MLDDIVDRYNNTYHNTIKMKSIDVKSSPYDKYNTVSNGNLKFKIGDRVRNPKS